MRYRHIKGATNEGIVSYNGIIDKAILTKEYYSLEVGVGKGKLISRLAEENPGNNYLGIEKNINACYQALKLIKNKELSNVDIIYADANLLLEYIKECSIKLIYLYFPDPWLKKRYHKRRLTSSSMISLYQTILVSGGEIELMSDSEEIYEEFKSNIYGIFDILVDEAKIKNDLFITDYYERAAEGCLIYMVRARKI